MDSITENNINIQPIGDENFEREKYPNRPVNHSGTPPFHDLFLSLFNPLNENIKRPVGPPSAKKPRTPHRHSGFSPHEVRRNIIERFISKWRKDVGNDIYPAFRLILPDKDRDRPMYGLKEKSIGKILIKIMKINKESEDGHNLLNWKQPRLNTSTKMAGDFAGRCFEIISKRSMRTSVGNMSISVVNSLLDKLSMAQKEETQQPIFEEFYQNMNAEELMWVIRIILRQMKVGATEKTFFQIWHPDADSLFNVSSNLCRVCWELYNPSLRLEGNDRGVTLMQCFQPQLAQFQMHSIEKMVERVRSTEKDGVFWIEEKLDGERIQLHMASDETIPGGKRFCFWSRKAKDYTYLYGSGFNDKQGAITRHIRDGFHENVENIILDGEMVTWNPEQDAMVPFGTLKTAAINLSKDMNSDGDRPLYRIFDILYLNNADLTSYTLRDRRRALEASIKTVHRRMEIHTYVESQSHTEVDLFLRKVVQEASEGLVLKNPLSPYRLNERNDDWMKVKPEYMAEYGESLDCIIVGGYYGSGRRGGNLSSFLCGLKIDENEVQKGANPMKCVSFFKVGGGFTAADYAEIRHRTEGNWMKWNAKHPPSEFLELAGGPLQYERPDMWIRPDKSVVVSVKAASVSKTDQFKTGLTLRFPRFKRLRIDRDWKSALSISGFLSLQKAVEKEKNEKKFMVDDGKRKRQRLTRKKPLTVMGNSSGLFVPSNGIKTTIFQGLNFYVTSGSLTPEKKSKIELENIIKSNGGQIYQKYDAAPKMICIGDQKTVKAVSLIKHGNIDITRPGWILACVEQNMVDANREKLVLPMEPRQMLYTTNSSKSSIGKNADDYGDSFARDVSVKELETILDLMSTKSGGHHDFGIDDSNYDYDFDELPGWLFKGLILHRIQSNHSELEDSIFLETQQTLTAHELRIDQACNTARFAGAEFVENFNSDRITHIVVNNNKSAKSIREKISSRKRLPRLVTIDWIEQSWAEKTLLDEERFAPL